MKEIKMNGKLECNFNTQLKRHMDNVGSKLNDLADAIKLARNEGYNLTVDISKLEIEEVANQKEKANCIRQDTLIVKINACSTLSKLNELVEKANEMRKEHNCNCTLLIKII